MGDLSPQRSRVLDQRLASYLERHESSLREIASDTSSHYWRYPIPKKQGSVRWIEAPKPELKEVQRELLTMLLYQLPVHERAHGFIPNRSIITHAQNHVGRRWVLTLDLSDFFPSTHRGLIRQHFEPLLKSHCSPEHCELIIDLCLLKDRLPQGAPTSPQLSNVVFRTFDAQLEEWAQAHSLTYSRYADDLSFSGDQLPRDFYRQVHARVHPYRLNPKKTRVLGRGSRQLITGLVVNERVNLPRAQRRKLRAIAHRIATTGVEATLKINEWTQDELSGHVAWLAQVSPHDYHQLFSELSSLK